ncbi:MAG TPA: phosphate ABC transporter permease subunit PstC [Acidobacteriota bacterium]|nr:phosphate ABC transporter permease subunit PstC [Acidobacteriota bacterium]
MTVSSAAGNHFCRVLPLRSPFTGWEESFDETLARLAFFLLLITGIAMLLLALAMVAREAYPTLFAPGGLWGLLIADAWEPLSQPARLGVRHAWLSTLAATSVALAFAVPVGFGIGIFIAEIAPSIVKKMLQPCLELLAGIPSVVYGFFGYVTLVPWFESRFEMATGESLFAAGLILAVMILPFVASTSAEALGAVPGDIKEAALSLGVNRCSMTFRVLVRHAAPGMFAAVALGLARALGETLAVLMLAGNSVAVPSSLLDRGQPITALIITELGEAGIGSPKQQALFAAALVLMVVIVVVNGVIAWLKRRMLHGRA